MVGRSGVTLYSVVTVKRGVLTHVAVDGGMADNLEPMLYGQRFAPRILDRERPPETCELVGHHCESGDVLVNGVALATPQVDDLLLMPVTGAYCYSLLNNYNGARRPPVVLVRRRRRAARGPPRAHRGAHGPRRALSTIAEKRQIHVDPASGDVDGPDGVPDHRHEQLPAAVALDLQRLARRQRRASAAPPPRGVSPSPPTQPSSSCAQYSPSSSGGTSASRAESCAPRSASAAARLAWPASRRIGRASVPARRSIVTGRPSSSDLRTGAQQLRLGPGDVKGAVEPVRAADATRVHRSVTRRCR